MWERLLVFDKSFCKNQMNSIQQIEIPFQFDTKRLLIRSFKVEDGPKLHRALLESIVELREYLWFLPWVGEEQTLASAEARCLAASTNFSERNDLAYLAFDKSSGRLLASVGLHRTDWSLPKTEVGFWVRSSETGKGYATECVNALTDWALNDLGAIRVDLVTSEHNMGSRAVAEACGFNLESISQDDLEWPDGETKNICLYAKLCSTN